MSFRDRPSNKLVQVYIVDADGSHPIHLSAAISVAFDPTWSPDSEHLAFVAGNRDIYMTNLDGSNLVNLTNLTDNSALVFTPAWSPDAKYIAFVEEHHDKTQDVSVRDIYETD